MFGKLAFNRMINSAAYLWEK